METVETIILALYALVNVFTFIAFLCDKAKAKVKWWRFSESSLLILSVFGAIGGTLGMLVAHHKVSKTKFKLVYLFCVIHIVIIAMFLTGYIKLPSL